MKRNIKASSATEAAAGLERLRRLADQLASAPGNSRQRRTLSAAIQLEANAYRKSLDSEQAAARHDANPLRGIDLAPRR